MAARRSKEPQSTHPHRSQQQALTEIATARQECLAKLKAIEAGVQELMSRTSTDVTRALAETQMDVGMRQQALLLDYQDKAQRASASPGCAQQIDELSKRCMDDLQLSIQEAQKTFSEACEKANAKLNSGISEANREWEETCLGFFGALRQRMVKAESVINDPVHLAQIGQSLSWIASLMRRPAET